MCIRDRSQQCDAAFYLDPQAGVDLARLVHGEQFFEHHRPLVAGDAVTGRMQVDSVRTVGGHTMVGTSVVLSVGGDPVCTTRSTIVIRGAVSYTHLVPGVAPLAVLPVLPKRAA